MRLARLLSLVLLAACSQEPGSGSPPPAGGGAAGPPARIVPATASAVDWVLALVDPARIAASPAIEGEFGNASGYEPAPGATFSGFEAESLLAFDPDLVIAGPWQSRDTVERLREAGVTVEVLPVVERLEDLRATALRLGAVLGADAAGAELLADIDRRVAVLAAGAEGRDLATGLSYTNFGSGGWTAGAGTTRQILFELVGLENVAARGRRGHYTLDIEAFLTLDPDVVVVSRPSETYGASAAYLRSEPALAGLRAVREDRIVELSSALFSADSQHLIAAAEALAAALDALP